MFRRIKSKRARLALAAVAVFAIAGAAFAYFTSTGSDTKTGTVGAASNWTVTGASETASLYPFTQSDLTATPSLYTALANGKVQNAGSGRQELQKIIATIQAPTGAGSDSSKPACTAADFRLFSPTGTWTISGSSNGVATITPNVDLAPNGSSGDTYSMSDLSVAMVDNGANQDNCQGATVNIKYDAS